MGDAGVVPPASSFSVALRSSLFYKGKDFMPTPLTYSTLQH